MRRLLLLLALAATASAARAQTPAPASLATAHYSAADTIRAVQHLFQKRTRGGLGAADAGSTILSQGAVALALRTDSTSEGRRIEANQDLLMGSAMLGYGLFQSKRFGREQYAQVVAAYEQGEPLPPYVRRRLKPKYFRYRAF